MDTADQEAEYHSNLNQDGKRGSIACDIVPAVELKNMKIENKYESASR